MEQAADARESSWGWVHVVGQVDDGELRRVGTRKQRGIAKQKIETGCVLVFARR